MTFTPTFSFSLSLFLSLVLVLCICVYNSFVSYEWAIPGLFLVYFHLLKQTLQFLQQINVKNVQPIYSAGIRTHNLQNMSLLPPIILSLNLFLSSAYLTVSFMISSLLCIILATLSNFFIHSLSLSLDYLYLLYWWQHTVLYIIYSKTSSLFATFLPMTGTHSQTHFWFFFCRYIDL